MSTNVRWCHFGAALRGSHLGVLPASSIFRRQARMIVVHHLENSRSQRILWLLEELQVPYEVSSPSLVPTAVDTQSV